MKNKISFVGMLTVVGALAAVLTGCGASQTSASDSAAATSATKTFTTQITNVADYIDEGNAFPLNFDHSDDNNASVFTFDAWALEGTKVNIDDDGNAIGCYWDISLSVEDKAGSDYVDYTFDVHWHGAHSDSYTEDVDAYYSYEGMGYQKDGGYHLFTAQYAEATVVGQAMDQTGGWGAGDGSNANVQELVGKSGNKVYYYYTNSELQAAGFSFGFPFMGKLTSTFFENDTLIDGNAIKGWANVTKATTSYSVTQGIDSGAVDEILEDYGLIDAALESDNDIVKDWANEDGTITMKFETNADGNLQLDWTEPDRDGNPKTSSTTDLVYNKVSGLYTFTFVGMGTPGTVTATFNDAGGLDVDYTSGGQPASGAFYLASDIGDGSVIGDWTSSLIDSFGSTYNVTATLKEDNSCSIVIPGFSTDTFIGTYTNNKGVVTVKVHHEPVADKEGVIIEEGHDKYYPNYQPYFNTTGGATLILQSGGTFVWGPAPAEA